MGGQLEEPAGTRDPLGLPGAHPAHPPSYPWSGPVCPPSLQKVSLCFFLTDKTISAEGHSIVQTWARQDFAAPVWQQDPRSVPRAPWGRRAWRGLADGPSPQLPASAPAGVPRTGRTVATRASPATSASPPGAALTPRWLASPGASSPSPRKVTCRAAGSPFLGPQAPGSSWTATRVTQGKRNAPPPCPQREPHLSAACLMGTHL